MRREPRLLRLARLDAPLVLRSGKLLAFTLLAMTPTLIVMYVAGLFWIPQSWQNLRLARIMMGVEDLYGGALDEYLGVLREMHGMVAGFWAGFPMMVMTSIVVAGFVSGERASGTFDLLAAKPVHRYELVASKVLVFLGYAFLVLLLIHALNALVVASSFYGGLGAEYVLRALCDAGSIIVYYALASWLYVLAVTSLTLLFSTRTTREFVAVMGVVGYHIALAFSAGMVQALISGRTGRLVSEFLEYADFSHHARVLMTKWLYGSLAPLGERIVPPSYGASLAIMVAAPLAMIAAGLVVVERMDLA